LHETLKTALTLALVKNGGALELSKQLGGKIAPPKQLGFRGMAQKMVASLKK
jgi:hypothetical protein